VCSCMGGTVVAVELMLVWKYACVGSCRCGNVVVIYVLVYK